MFSSFVTIDLYTPAFEDVSGEEIMHQEQRNSNWNTTDLNQPPLSISQHLIYLIILHDYVL